MTEKEKCRLGLLYDANYDPEILADRERAKELLYDYNRLRPSEQIRRLTKALEGLKERGYYVVGLDGGGDKLVGETGFESDPLVVVHRR